jgi:hypothetical protein
MSLFSGSGVLLGTVVQVPDSTGTATFSEKEWVFYSYTRNDLPWIQIFG